jgi:hypothetical protein
LNLNSAVVSRWEVGELITQQWRTTVRELHVEGATIERVNLLCARPLPALRTLRLAFTRMSPEEWNTIANATEGIPALEEVSLEGSGSLPEGCMRWLASQRQLLSLDLSSCALTYKQCIELSKHTWTETVEMLDLSFNNATNTGIIQLLLSLQNVRHLRLTHCKIPSQFWDELVNKPWLEHLETMYLPLEPASTNKGLAAFRLYLEKRGVQVQ